MTTGEVAHRFIKTTSLKDGKVSLKKCSRDLNPFESLTKVIKKFQKEITQHDLLITSNHLINIIWIVQILGNSVINESSSLKQTSDVSETKITLLSASIKYG